MSNDERAADTPARILVVDDLAANVKLLADLLVHQGYQVATAASGAEGLAVLEDGNVDLVLLDVVMPDMDGYVVCAKIRQQPQWVALPVVMVTALDAKEERIKGLESGADDFLSKPINPPELLARVRSLLRIKRMQDRLQRQAAELAQWAATLEQRVDRGVAEVERLSRLKRFFSPKVADLILSGNAGDPLHSHRREIVVVYLDLRGFTAFAETSEPEEIMGVLRAYHSQMGEVILAHEGTLERFAGDGMMVFFNDPVQVPDPAVRAVRMVVEMRERLADLTTTWKKRGFSLDFGAGIAQGYATIGAIGFEGRWDYGAIGTVTNMAARLCGEARTGQILISQRVVGSVSEIANMESVGELQLRGFLRPVPAFNLIGLK